MQRARADDGRGASSHCAPLVTPLFDARPPAAHPPIGGAILAHDTPHRDDRPVAARYGVALLCAVLALLLAGVVHPVVPHLTWLPLVGAVGIAAWYGRFGPGVVTAVVGTLSILWLHIDPVRSFTVTDPADLIWALSFLAVAGLVSVLLDAMHLERAAAAATADRYGSLLAQHEAVGDALRTSESRLAGVVGSVMDAIVSVDDERRIVVFNPAAERMFRVTAQDAIGTTLDRFLPLGFDGIPDVPVASINPVGTGASLTPLVAVRADATEFPIEATVSRATSGSERLRTIVLRDITERRTLEAQLLQAQKMEGIGQLAGGVAHDFNNILTVIKSYAEFLRAGLADNATLRGDVDEVITATDRAVGLTKQLLAFSRRQSLAPRLLDPNAIVRGMEAMLRRLLGEDIELVAPLATSPGLVRVDPGQLEQVLVNLTVNARDALVYGGLITIETAFAELTADDVHRHATRSPTAQPERPGAYVVLRVSDSGVGMDAITQRHMFEPFFTTKPAGRGTGLGLATVYGIVQQSGGHIRVRSAPQQGTTFELYLPRHAPAETDDPDLFVAAGPTGGTETVLLVEDEMAVRRSVRRLLERAGYRVIEARHGADALLVWRETHGAIDLLLTDVRMPELGGVGLVNALHGIRPDLPVLLISGYAADETAGASPKGDGVASLPSAVFIEKPFTGEELLRGVREALDRRVPR